MRTEQFQAELVRLLEGNVPESERSQVIEALRRAADALGEPPAVRQLIELMAAEPGQRDVVDAEPPAGYWESFGLRLDRRLADATGATGSAGATDTTDAAGPTVSTVDPATAALRPSGLDGQTAGHSRRAESRSRGARTAVWLAAAAALATVAVGLGAWRVLDPAGSERADGAGAWPAAPPLVELEPDERARLTESLERGWGGPDPKPSGDQGERSTSSQTGMLAPDEPSVSETAKRMDAVPSPSGEAQQRGDSGADDPAPGTGAARHPAVDQRPALASTTRGSPTADASSTDSTLPLSGPATDRASDETIADAAFVDLFGASPFDIEPEPAGLFPDADGLSREQQQELLRWLQEQNREYEGVS